MYTFRRTWLALMGAILLITLSVSATLGAKPTGTDGPRGQSVAAFVHELVFGSEETDEDEVVNEDEDEATDDDEDGSDEDEELVEEDSERQVPEEFANHGECVSTAAHDSDGFEESDADSFGGWMSMRARYVCWGLDVPGEEAEEEAVDETTAEEDADEPSAKEQREAERAAARAERKAERTAARAERNAQKAEARAAGGAGGHDQGKAHGGGRN